VEELNKVDVLFIGAGPSSLAGAIKLKRLLNEAGRKESVVVIEKAAKPGQHSLSGAVFEAQVLDELIPDWQKSEDKFITQMLANQVKHDETVFLRANQANKIPESVVPAPMRHIGNYAISLSEMINWLNEIAVGLGVEIFNGFAAKELVIENKRVKGVKLDDKGLDKERHKLPNYISGDVIEAKVTILGEGSAGQLGEKLIKELDSSRKNTQIFSLGVKEIIRLPAENKFGANHVVHTMGYPLPSDIFGGGTLYSMSANEIAVALIISLDWKYCNLNPQQELQLLKSHPFVKTVIEGGQVIAYGAKTLPEGGYYSLADLYYDGALIIGDDAGLTNVRKLKGLHYAIKSGIVAGEAAFSAIKAQNFTKQTLKAYREGLENSFVIKEMKAAKNYRQVFSKFGLYGGVAASFCQSLFPRLGTEPDHENLRRVKLNRGEVGNVDRLTAVSLSGTTHREDEPSHITFLDEGQDDKCFREFGCHPCESFCPAEVYKFEDNKLILSPSNCLHCQTCRIKCPHQIIKWEVPEGGDGPKYKLM
jgi:electron-transferring-flavoprotein dehydrogenase